MGPCLPHDGVHLLERDGGHFLHQQEDEVAHLAIHLAGPTSAAGPGRSVAGLLVSSYGGVGHGPPHAESFCTLDIVLTARKGLDYAFLLSSLDTLSLGITHLQTATALLNIAGDIILYIASTTGVKSGAEYNRKLRTYHKHRTSKIMRTECRFLPSICSM